MFKVRKYFGGWQRGFRTRERAEFFARMNQRNGIPAPIVEYQEHENIILTQGAEQQFGAKDCAQVATINLLRFGFGMDVPYVEIRELYDAVDPRAGKKLGTRQDVTLRVLQSLGLKIHWTQFTGRAVSLRKHLPAVGCGIVSVVCKNTNFYHAVAFKDGKLIAHRYDMWARRAVSVRGIMLVLPNERKQAK